MTVTLLHKIGHATLDIQFRCALYLWSFTSSTAFSVKHRFAEAHAVRYASSGSYVEVFHVLRAGTLLIKFGFFIQKDNSSKD